MEELCVQRRLVKSPPELWAEVSDPAALGRHLDPFGEIRIARLEPETTVAWEGERASGTVVLDAAGWGTRVTLTAAMRPQSAVPEPVDDGPAPSAPQPQRVAIEGAKPALAEEPAGGPAVVEPVAAEMATSPSAAPNATVPRAPQGGFLSRLFGRARGTSAAGPPSSPLAPKVHHQPEPQTPTASPVTEDAAPPVQTTPDPAPGLDTATATSALEQVLDTLGAAHHRPFSR